MNRIVICSNSSFSTKHLLRNRNAVQPAAPAAPIVDSYPLTLSADYETDIPCGTEVKMQGISFWIGRPNIVIAGDGTPLRSMNCIGLQSFIVELREGTGYYLPEAQDPNGFLKRIETLQEFQFKPLTQCILRAGTTLHNATTSFQLLEDTKAVI